MQSKLIAFLSDRKAATAIEYGLIVGLIAVVIMYGLAWVGYKLFMQFERVTEALI